MLRIFLYLLSAIAVLGADDPWAKVREIKSGAELRIYKKNARQPLLAKMDEATAENLIVVLKNEQVAIPKNEIDRVDCRPAQSGSRIIPESKTTTDPPGQEAPPAGPRRGAQGPSASTSGGLSIRPKPDFDTIYRRTATPVQK